MTTPHSEKKYKERRRRYWHERKTKFNGLYAVWRGMKTRCFNSNIKDYKYWGGRGITICEEWRDNFQAFYRWAIKNGHKKGLTIDRKDNDGNYCPENCRFITRKESRCNQSDTNGGASLSKKETK